ncbi:GNAT family N-acetyltransferase [Paenibacillus sp. FSL W7-1287]|uniref:GNAT family N-acetyltransferase n=1 Tax=Paenibacillus sp. FSL W7-1287 TaxID=2954538 RepID=UPI0030F4F65D
MIIRTEEKKDYESIYEINVEAFNNREDEAKLVERIRQSDKFIAELSLVGQFDDETVGYALFSKATVHNENEVETVIVLAPIAVKPAFQKQGIGKALIEEGIKRSKALGYNFILLIGHPTYYSKLGFKPARNYGLELTQFEVPDDVFMVYELRENKLGVINGELVYPEAFFQ